MFRRMLLIAALVLAAGGAAFASPAGAQNYGGCTASVSDDTPTPGQVITVSGTGAALSGTVTASLDDAEIGTGTADAAGEFSFSATIPTSASGSEELTVDCGGGSVDAITLTVGTAGGSGSLPATGSNSSLPLAQAAVAALALGGIALVASRRRAAKTSL
jgi:LPXTG-motif cell wall-anchored protein